jgi:flagellar motor protein MotB
VIVDIKTLKFSRTISGFGYKKRDANLPSVENNIKAAMTVLLPIIKKIKEHPDGSQYKIQIIGHADGSGPEDPRGDKPGNITISRERAEGVLDYIVANYNLSRDMFEVVAKGSSELKNSSNPEAAANRRVVIVFAP